MGCCGGGGRGVAGGGVGGRGARSGKGGGIVGAMQNFKKRY